MKRFALAVIATVVLCVGVLVAISVVHITGLFRNEIATRPTPKPRPEKMRDLTADDVDEILSKALKQFPEMEPKSKNKPAVREFNVLKESLASVLFPAHQLPEISGLTIKLVTQPEIEAQRQLREIEYYEFSGFRDVGGNPTLGVVWNKRDKDSFHTTGFDFTAIRAADEWIVSRQVTGVSVAEHP